MTRTPPPAIPPSTMDRRRFLAMFGATAAASATALACGSQIVDTDPASATTLAEADPATANRTLVVIELQGGNDGLAMLQPLDDGRLHAARPRLAKPADELIVASDAFGWHPALGGIVEAGAAAIVGIGSDQPNFSHFEMENRWWRGDSRPNGGWTTGIFGRMCDELEIGDPVTGLSLAGGPSPGLSANKAVTVGLVDPEANWFMQQDASWFNALRSAQRTMAGNEDTGSTARAHSPMAASRSGIGDALRFAESLADAPLGPDDLYPWTGLGQQLRFAAEVLALGVGVRVLHVQQGGYDTHDGQGWRYDELMTELNDATTIFVNDLKQRGLWQQTLVMTTSEFGRRMPENEGGTDHGSASTAMLIGDGLKGVHGEAPSLRNLDEGNLAATARFEDYYATVASGWFGLDTTELLPAGATSIMTL